MKKSLFILAGLALLGTSCAKTEEVVETSSGRAISFNGYAAKLTKAAQTDVTAENLESFNVTAIGNNEVYITNETYTKKGNVWESNPVHFWPLYPLTFYAYNTPGSTTDFTSEITTTAQTLTVTPSAILGEQEDLVAACAVSKSATNTNEDGAIVLEFKHYLTQVIVKAKNSSSSHYNVVVDGVKLANLAGDGIYTFSDGKMTASSEKINSASSSDYSATFPSKTLTADAQEVMTNTNEGTGRWYLIPQIVKAWDLNEPENSSNGTYLALKVKITTSNGAKIYPASGETSAWMAVPVPAGLDFVQGKRYNVTLAFYSLSNHGAGYVAPEDPPELDGNPGTKDNGKKIREVIMFQTSVSSWGDEVDVTISL